MVAHAKQADNHPKRRWITPPWDRNSPAWLDIDSRLEPDHPARLVDRLVDQLDLTELRNSYAGRGSSAYPPELLLRLVLFEAYRGNLSPSLWHSHCAELDPVKWLLFGLKPPLARLYEFFGRLERFLDDLNQQLLKAARAAGLLEADCVALDGTLVAALGSRHRVLTVKTLNERIEQLDAAFASPEQPAPEDPSQALTEQPTATAADQAAAGPLQLPQPVADQNTSAQADHHPAPAPAAPAPAASPSAKPLTPRERAALFHKRRRHRAALSRLKAQAKHYRQKRSRTAKAKRRSAKRLVICPSEPEAALGRDKLNTFRPLYNVQLARTVAGIPLIVGYDVVSAVNDFGQFHPLLRRTETLLGRRPSTVLVDSHYAGPTDLAIAQQLGVTVYAPIGIRKSRKNGAQESRKGLIPKEQFEWLPDEQTYRCPKGHRLKFLREGTELRAGKTPLKLMQYRCPPEHCRACPLAARCTRTPQRGRIVKRSEHDALVEELRHRMQAPESQALYRKRNQTVEQSYADVKQHRGLRRFHGFGRSRAWTQVGVLVLAVNGVTFQKALMPKPARKASPREVAA